MARFIALLRAVNVGGRKLPMAELRSLCAELGWADALTYIQSGNVVFTGVGKAEALETRMEKAIAARFGFHSDVIIRSAAQWVRLIEANPFAAASKGEPNRVLAGLAKAELKHGAAAEIAPRRPMVSVSSKRGRRCGSTIPRGSARRRSRRS